MRGEYSSVICRNASDPGSPPLARGIRRTVFFAGVAVGITPACAGNTDSSRKTHHTSRDHPRLRGEYSAGAWLMVALVGSPPLARGIPADGWYLIVPMGITPACAGNTSLSAPAASCTWDHPRLRGEYWFTTPMVTRSRFKPSRYFWRISFLYSALAEYTTPSPRNLSGSLCSLYT